MFADICCCNIKFKILDDCRNNWVSISKSVEVNRNNISFAYNFVNAYGMTETFGFKCFQHRKESIQVKLPSYVICDVFEIDASNFLIPPPFFLP